MVAAAGSSRPACARSSAKGNRVSLDRGALTEWYAAGPLGIEQGFTLSRRPAGTAGPLTLALQLGGGVRAHLDSGTVLLTQAGRPGLSYGQLWATDAKGRPLRAELQLRGGRLLIQVWDRGASYPLTIDPLIQQGNKLTGSGETGAGELRLRAWRCRPTGTPPSIGGPDDNGDVGAAWVFTRSGATWTQQGGKLTGTRRDRRRPRSASRVALSADGNTALIGGAADNDERRRGVGVHPLRRRPGRSRAQADGQRRVPAPAGSAPAWRCRPTATPP